MTALRITGSDCTFTALDRLNQATGARSKKALIRVRSTHTRISFKLHRMSPLWISTRNAHFTLCCFRR
jgi:hypothetical protein